MIRKTGAGSFVRRCFLSCIFLLAALAGSCAARYATPAAGLRQAEILSRDRRQDEAMDVLNRAHREHPNDITLLRARIRQAELVGRTEEVREDLMDQESSRPAIHHLGLGMLDAASDPLKNQQAFQHLERARAALPGDPEPVFRLGLMHYEREDFDQALPLLEEAAKLGPDRPDILVPLALTLHYLGETEKGKTVLNRVIEMEPEPAVAGRALAASNALRDPYRTVPSKLKTEFFRAAAWLEKYDVPGEALNILQPMVEAHDTFGLAHAYLGFAYAKIANDAAAFIHLDKAITLLPDYPEPYLVAGELMLRLERPAKARDYFQGAIKANPLNPIGYQKLGDLLMASSNAKEALPLFRKLVRLLPESADAHFSLAGALEANNLRTEAEEHYREAARIRPQSLKTWLKLAAIHAGEYVVEKDKKARKRHLEEARKAIDEALKLDPRNQIAREILTRMGEEE
ncbi:MAG: Beta-barrel assembly-enhancing protease [Myxococcota bacterium]|nr:Beta-barrel assembly-enhancing protease [Myxococcota bacterium]